jgi:hypothetical protein
MDEIEHGGIIPARKNLVLPKCVVGYFREPFSVRKDFAQPARLADLAGRVCLLVVGIPAASGQDGGESACATIV